MTLCVGVLPDRDGRTCGDEVQVCDGHWPTSQPTSLRQGRSCRHVRVGRQSRRDERPAFCEIQFRHEDIECFVLTPTLGEQLESPREPAAGDGGGAAVMSGDRVLELLPSSLEVLCSCGELCFGQVGLSQSECDDRVVVPCAYLPQFVTCPVQQRHSGREFFEGLVLVPLQSEDIPEPHKDAPCRRASNQRTRCGEAGDPRRRVSL
ncbi:hypothetical protein [Kineosporia sp. A_224]|uniref:hypothetical protein n=1 Tax=Kineosporia sp. A_224 TaxID=1962180 RepID=UPI00117AFF63|nr:hypothetical protein [Kineosporia sp. A_224]